MKNKLAFIVGGSGLIGKEVVNLLLLKGVKVINLDLIERKKNQTSTFRKETFYKFDCTNEGGFNEIDYYKKVDGKWEWAEDIEEKINEMV